MGAPGDGTRAFDDSDLDSMFEGDLTCDVVFTTNIDVYGPLAWLECRDCGDRQHERLGEGAHPVQGEPPPRGQREFCVGSYVLGSLRSPAKRRHPGLATGQGRALRPNPLPPPPAKV